MLIPPTTKDRGYPQHGIMKTFIDKMIEITDHLIEIKNDITQAIHMTGDHNKQWYLIRIAKRLNIEIDYDQIDEGRAP